ncbi:MAG: hypothetical protein SFW08_03075 [Gemmatimonadaceae bacterium]|nr:hypothetical protein [Gemmatimonadaceae bacterium]
MSHVPFRHIPRAAAAAAIVFAATAMPVAAQGGRPTQLHIERTSSTQIGARAVFSTEKPDGWGYGVQARFPVDWNLAVEPSVDIWSINGASTYQVNADVVAFDRRGWLYGRLGLAYHKPERVDGHYGLNLGLGSDLPYLFETPLRPFVEARWSVIHGSAPLRLLLGANIALGRR